MGGCVCFDYQSGVIMHYKIKSCCKGYYGQNILNVTAYISPIRLRNIAGDLSCVRARVSGWGKTSDSKYSFLIVLYVILKNFTYQIDCFKGGRYSWLSENFVVTVNTFYLCYDMQNLRAVQGCIAVLYEPANWCYNMQGPPKNIYTF